MTEGEPQDDDAPEAPLPRERARRIAEDADARGIPVVLQGGDAWYVLPLPLAPRGLKIARILDAIEDEEVALGASGKTVALASAALDAADTPEAVEAAKSRLLTAVGARRAVSDVVSGLYRDLGYHALRSLYRVTEEEAARLVTQRRFADVIQALNGRDTERSQQEMAIALFERLRKSMEGAASAGPLGSRSGSAGPAGSSSPEAQTPTA